MLVFHDVLGLVEVERPKVVRASANGGPREALVRWGGDVRQGTFPGTQECYRLPEELRETIANWKAPA
ncbi:hypothetical protein [Bradyrhizobium sp. CCBAU 53380]|uniref:hypothetical protein n=1 Tax=Bradyrhizobium sp. CCBAU 53380 TaxID=1325117 RepID=UPI003FA455E7